MTQNNKNRKTQETITKTNPSLPKGTNFINKSLIFVLTTYTYTMRHRPNKTNKTKFLKSKLRERKREEVSDCEGGREREKERSKATELR